MNLLFSALLALILIDPAHAKSPMSELTREQAKRLFSNEPEPVIEISIPRKPIATPEVLDWRNRNGRNWVTSIRQQGECNSCTALAAAATLETQWMIQSGLPEISPHLSAQALFSCGGGSCQTGWHSSRAADFIVREGIPDEACLPYTSGATGMTGSCQDACSDRSHRSVRATRLRRPTQGVRDVDAVNAPLRQGPGLSTMFIYPDFLTYTGGVYRHLTGEGLGGHAVSIVGFSDLDQAWIIKNSWGEEWGEGGFGRVAWDDLSGVGLDTWGFELPGAPGSLSIQSPAEREVLSGDAEFRALAQGINGALQLTLLNAAKAKVVEATSATGVFRVNTRTLADGAYEAYVTSNSGANAPFESAHLSFFILNRAVTASLRMKPLNFIPARATDRILLEVFLSSSPIPLSRLEFRVEKDGKLIAKKSVDTTAPEMLVGWNSASSPNGEYDLRISAFMDSRSHPLRVDGASLRIQVQNNTSH